MDGRGVLPDNENMDTTNERDKMNMDSPNPVVATLDGAAADGGTIRIYRDGMVDAVNGSLYSLSPGFTSVREFEVWLAAELAKDEKRRNVRESADAYCAARDGEQRANGTTGPTPLAVRTLELIHAAHMRGDGIELSRVGVSTLWAEIMRRTCAGLGLE